jgi:HAD superfamily hydrolase (TIGR01490 family)
MTALKPAAFFDLDGTLITGNSGLLWMKHERKLGRLSTYKLTMGTLYFILYKIRAINMLQATRNALGTITGREETELATEIANWYENEVKPFTAADGLAAIEKHRQQGHRLVLLTSCSIYEAKVATADFKLDDYLCTRYEVKDGRFTGDFIEPLCYGAGKVIHAERFAREHNIDVDASYFYTDSCTDLPMLERVTYPMVVNPDVRLRWVAKRKGWPILNWS